MSHSSGPWKVRRQGVVSDAEGNVICTLGFRVAVGSTEDDDNATLIAAAPSMLDALRYYAAIKGPVGEPARTALALIEASAVKEAA